jgi:hypothetical protein
MTNRVNLAERAAATDAVLKRFRNRALDFKSGATCLHLFRAQLIKLGHKPPRIPAFQSALGASKAMKRAGFEDLAAVIDSVLPRIAPAAMLVGDFGLLPGGPDGLFDALVMSVGGKVLGWHDSDLSKMSVIADIPLSAYLAAWRV